MEIERKNECMNKALYNASTQAEKIDFIISQFKNDILSNQAKIKEIERQNKALKKEIKRIKALKKSQASIALLIEAHQA